MQRKACVGDAQLARRSVLAGTSPYVSTESNIINRDDAAQPEQLDVIVRVQSSRKNKIAATTGCTGRYGLLAAQNPWPSPQRSDAQLVQGPNSCFARRLLGGVLDALHDTVNGALSFLSHIACAVLAVCGSRACTPQIHNRRSCGSDHCGTVS